MDVPGNGLPRGSVLPHEATLSRLDILMRRLSVVAAGVAAAALALTSGPAFGWDCIRASSSQSGLMHSTRSGNWEYLTINDLVDGAVQSGMFDEQTGQCVLDAWQAAGEPSYFAIGAGVAGARGDEQSGHISDTDFFELAKNAPLKVMINGTGVDHLDDALEAFAGPCLAG